MRPGAEHLGVQGTACIGILLTTFLTPCCYMSSNTNKSLLNVLRWKTGSTNQYLIDDNTILFVIWVDIDQALLNIKKNLEVS